jgi:hypothetical protein
VSILGRPERPAHVVREVTGNAGNVEGHGELLLCETWRR